MENTLNFRVVMTLISANSGKGMQMCYTKEIGMKTKTFL